MADEQIVGSPEREIHVEALVQLQRVNLQPKEENEEEVFKMRAKLYRYHTDEKDGSMWKERGVGDIKIMKDRLKGTYRVVMRRDKTLKLCANHAISSMMELKPLTSSDKAWIWSTPCDYADGEESSETLCVRFGKPESATEFKEKFEECINSMKKTDDKDSSDKLAKDLSELGVKDENENTEKPSDATNDEISKKSDSTTSVEEKSPDDNEKTDSKINEKPSTAPAKD